jgi:hypothetical protein
VTHLNTHGNVIDDPAISGLSRTTDGKLDPRVNGNGAAYGRSMAINDPWFLPCRDIGAFEDENWALCWTALDAYGYFGDLVSAVDEPVLSHSKASLLVYPNPANDVVHASFHLSDEQILRACLLDVRGTMLQQTTFSSFSKGQSTIEISLQHLPPGVYFIMLQSNQLIFDRSVFIKK